MRIALFLLPLFLSAPLYTAAQVQFEDTAFKALVAKAKTEDKLVMVDAFTTWCGWCKVMDRETFADSAVGAYINERFISTKIDMEEGFGIDLAMKHRVSQYPTYLFFDADGQLLARLSGFMKPAAFIDAVETAIYSESHLPKGNDPMNFNLMYPEWHRNSFLKNKERSYPSAEQLEQWLAGRDDLSDEVSWGVMQRFVNGGIYALRIAEMRDTLTAKYGWEEVKSKLSALIFNDVKSAIKDRDEEQLQHALSAVDRYLSEDAEAYKLRYRLYYFQVTEDWKRYTDAVDEMYSDSEMYDTDAVVHAAQTIRSKSMDEAALAKALGWIQPMMVDDPEYLLLVLYAGLLQKTGSIEEARKFAEKAIEKGDDEGIMTTDAQFILNSLP